jgi:hypothetical protein
MNEHTALLHNTSGPYKRKRIGDGISLLLAKNGDTTISHSYKFDASKYTRDEAQRYLDKLGADIMEFKEAQIRASKPEIDGKVWGAGLHHVFVNDEPALVWVEEDTIMDAFKQMKQKISDKGYIDIGIDHLSDDILKNNEILAKMNLLDVGKITDIVTDGRGIFINDSHITNDSIRYLNEIGELPAYSIVGVMDAKPCPTGKADYVLKSIDVERVDLVNEGGCTSCKVGAQPDIVLTAKLSTKNEEKDIMVDANEAPKEESVEEVTKEEEVPDNEAAPVEEAEEVVTVESEKEEDAQKEEDIVEVAPEEEQDEQESETEKLRQEIASLKDEIKQLGGKKPSLVSDDTKSIDAEKKVSELIKAGKALPKMKDSLVAIASNNPDEFDRLAASMPKMVMMETKAKLAKVKKEERIASDEAKKLQAEKEMAKRYFGVEL